MLLFTSSYIDVQRKIMGTVSDDSGSLPGASVAIKNTSKGVTTDFDGNYSIDVNSGDILVFSYVGMIAQEILVNTQTTINVTLLSDSNELDEVIMLGMELKKKKKLLILYLLLILKP